MTDEQPEQITEAEMQEAPDWAWNLADAIVLGNQGCGNAAVLIQRTFAEREAELVGALRTIKHSVGQARIPGNDWKRELSLIENLTDAALKSREAGHG